MFTLNCNGRLLTIDTPLVMGIVNITPDSFYQPSRHTHAAAIIDHAGSMLGGGATLLDVGGQSTRPGSTLLEQNEELDRVLPAVEAIVKNFPGAIISIDTFYATVARAAIQAGAHIVNDVSAGDMDENMIATVGSLRVPYICMHMQGTPQTMQQQPRYSNLVQEILDYFIQKVEACRLAGIHDVIIDPGFGFGKTHQHNFQLLHRLQQFTMLNKPILVGLSRKGTIYRTLNITPEAALNGTTVLHTIALLNGAHILRVHDPLEARQAITLIHAYLEAQP